MSDKRKKNFAPLSLNNIHARCKTQKGCKIWTGALSKLGYPYVHDPKKHQKRLLVGSGGVLRSARPVVFELKYKKKPEGRIVMTCGNKLCLEPEHMRDVSMSVMLREYGNLHTTRRQIACKANMLKATKLDWAKVRAIREALSPYKGARNPARTAVMRELAARYGVSLSCINGVRNGTKWAKPHIVPMSSVWSMVAQPMKEAA